MEQQIRQGQFIVVEGMDGSGKSYCTDVLSEILRQLGKDVVQTFEVGGTPVGKELRQLCFKNRADEVIDPVARMLMIYASRLQHLRNVVFPAVQAGKTVVTDRYVPSSRVYQGAIDGLNSVMDDLDRMNGLTITAQPADIYVYLSVDPEVAFKRGVARQNVDNDTYKNDLQKAYRIHDAYEAHMAKYMGRPDCLVYRIDANQTPEDVNKSLLYVAQEIVTQAAQMPFLASADAAAGQAPVSGSSMGWNAAQLPRTAAGPRRQLRPY